MMALPRALRGFDCITSQFEAAARFGTVDEMFGVLCDRMTATAQAVSQRAVAQGHKDIDDTPIAVAFGGDATAVGTDTTTSGLVLGKAVDVGLVSFAMGTCEFRAAAESDPDGSSAGSGAAVATTSSFAHATGADFVIIITRSGATTLDANAEFSFSTSQTSFLAIDLEFWDSARGPIVVEYDLTLCRLRVDGDLDGNLAVLESMLDAFGEDSLTTLDATNLAVENTLSTTTAVGLLAVG